MHKVIVLLAALLLSVGSSAGEEIPELEEWFKITGDGKGPIGRVFSYLPQFEPSRGGTNATLVPVYSAAPTWYNRYQGDTIDQFDWPVLSGQSMRQGDLNNDGINEYVSRTGKVHRGIGNGQPPEKAYTSYSTWFSSVLPLEFHDVDNNGYTDAIAHPGYFADPWLAVVLFGGEDVTTLRTQVIWRRKQGKQNEFLLGVLPQKVGGKVRLISRSYEEAGFQQAKWVSYVLRELSAVPSGDTVRFELTTLDSISDAAMRPEKFYGLFSGDILQSRSDEPVLFATPLLGENVTEFYDISQGHFTLIRRFSPWEGILYPHALQQSINDDVYNDYFLSVSGRVALYAGSRAREIDTVPIATFRDQCDAGEGIITLGIGDVTGDGVGDIAVAYNNALGCFVIYKGVARRTVGVPEAVAGYSHLRFAMQQNYPNPVPSNGSALLPIDIEQPGEYTLRLYTLQGTLVHEFYRGVLQVGRYQMPLEFAGLGLAPGFYALRLGDGTRQCERGVLVQ